MEFRTITSPHLPPVNHVSQVMRQVLYALVPGTLAAAWYFGWGVLVNVAWAVLLAVGMEAVVLRLRQRPLDFHLGDLSAVVTGWLLALALPQLAPWWLTLVGVFFAIVVAKHLYGGLGYNPFNPAMVGYVVLLVSFPAAMTQWLGPHQVTEHALTLGETLRAIFLGQFPAHLPLDALSMATPLDTVKTGLSMDKTLAEIRSAPLFGDFSGRGWEWVANWYALGGFWLLYKRIIPWQVPLGLILGLAVPAGIFYLYNPDHYASPAFHVFSGGAMLGAFFIATDPVSGSTTPLGRLLFGLGAGLTTWVIRTWGGYPDAIAFSVLLMNMLAPTIDQYTRPRVFGQGRGHD